MDNKTKMIMILISDFKKFNPDATRATTMRLHEMLNGMTDGDLELLVEQTKIKVPATEGSQQ